MFSVTLNFVAIVTKEQMDSTQITMTMFHSPFRLGAIYPDLQKDIKLFTS